MTPKMKNGLVKDSPKPGLIPNDDLLGFHRMPSLARPIENVQTTSPVRRPRSAGITSPTRMKRKPPISSKVCQSGHKQSAVVHKNRLSLNSSEEDTDNESFEGSFGEEVSLGTDSLCFSSSKTSLSSCEEIIMSPNSMLRRDRVRTFDPNGSYAIKNLNANKDSDLSSLNPTAFRLASLGSASTERLRRNTDSLMEDVVVARRIKSRLEARWYQQSKNAITNTALSDFIMQHLTGGQPLDAEAAAQPTSTQVLKAAELARKTIVEGYFANFKDPNVDERVQHAFLASVHREEYNQGDIICRLHDPGDKLYVIEEGSVQFTVGDQIAGSASSGSVFGEISLVFGVPRDATVTVVSPCLIAWTLDDLSFRRIQGIIAKNSIDEHKDPALKNYMINQLRKQASALTDTQEISHQPRKNKIHFKNLVKQAVLGEGTFGCVYLVTHKVSPNAEEETLALKCLSKVSIIEKKNEKRIMIERNALREVSDCPFVIKLLETYQDKNHVYFLSDFVQGGSLFAHMVRSEVLPHSECVFLTACLASALVHIHRKGFVHRDLKPENCLIGTDGYLKLCDFGMAKRLPATIRLPSGGTEVVALAFTMCGTPEFTAPEMLLGKGYDKCIDWWAFGCLLSEMYSGWSPFDGNGDLKRTMREILLVGLERHKFAVPECFRKRGMTNASSLLASLLVPLEKRLGRTDGMDILGHAYFDVINFELLKAKRIVPPETPTILHKKDLSYFKENFDEDDENIKGDNREYRGDNEWCNDF